MAEEMKFEKALDRLGKIVEVLEQGDVTLDDALKYYEEGVRLSKVCQDHLSRAEKKIEVLTRSLDGRFVKEPFLESESEGPENSKPAAKSSKNSKRIKQTPDTSVDGDVLI